MLHRVRNSLIPVAPWLPRWLSSCIPQLFRRGGGLYRVLKSRPPPALASQALVVGLPMSLQKCGLVGSKFGVYQCWPFTVGQTDRQITQKAMSFIRVHPCL